MKTSDLQNLMRGKTIPEIYEMIKYMLGEIEDTRYFRERYGRTAKKQKDDDKTYLVKFHGEIEVWGTNPHEITDLLENWDYTQLPLTEEALSWGVNAENYDYTVDAIEEIE